MKIKINKQTTQNLTDNILTVNYIKEGSTFQIKSVDLDFNDLTADQKTLVTNFIALLEAKTLA